MGAIEVKDFFLTSPLLTLILVSGLPVGAKALNGFKEVSPAIVRFFSFVSLSVALFLTFIMRPEGVSYAFGGSLIFDEYSFIIGATLLFSFYVILVQFFEIGGAAEKFFSEHTFLLHLSFVGLLIALLANHLLLLFAALELAIMPLYFCIGINKKNEFGKEATLKLFILNSLPVVFGLLGLSFIYGATGSLVFSDILQTDAQLLLDNKLFLLGLLLFLSNFLFKSTLFPFHFWSHDVLKGSPNYVVSLVSICVKVVAVYAIVRIFNSELFSENSSVINLFQWLGVITFFVSSFFISSQKDIKSALICFSQAHSGFFALAIVTLSSTENVNVLIKVFIYTISYVVLFSAAFLFLDILERENRKSLLVDDLQGYFRNFPYQAFLWSVLILGLAGFPPLLGFWGLLHLYLGGVSEGFLWVTIWSGVLSLPLIMFAVQSILKIYLPGQCRIENGLSRKLKSTNVLLVLLCMIAFMGLFSEKISQALAAVLIIGS